VPAKSPFVMCLSLCRIEMGLAAGTPDIYMPSCGGGRRKDLSAILHCALVASNWRSKLCLRVALQRGHGIASLRSGLLSTMQALASAAALLGPSCRRSALQSATRMAGAPSSAARKAKQAPLTRGAPPSYRLLNRASLTPRASRPWRGCMQAGCGAAARQVAQRPETPSPPLTAGECRNRQQCRGGADGVGG